MFLSGCTPAAEIHSENWPAGEFKPGEAVSDPERARYQRLVRQQLIYGQRLKPETLIMMIGLWKTLLFVPCVGLIFAWCRSVYGVRSGYLSLALLLVDPTFAANVPIAALDSFGIEALVLTCFLYWRYFEFESTGRLLAASVSTAAALLIKHTAVILPGVFAMYAAYYWIYLPWRGGRLRTEWSMQWKQRRRQLAMSIAVGAVSLWALLLFDVSVPFDQVQEKYPSSQLTRFQNAVLSILQVRMPAGTYVGCFTSGFIINHTGQASLLFGKISGDGFWYYFPAVATLKVPIGIFIVLALALISLWRKRWFAGEHSILIPLIAWLGLLLMSKMNYSFRHFMPAYVFIIMWAGRSVAEVGIRWIWGAWLAVGIAAAHVMTLHPEYLSYINFPRDRVDLQITDSNLDWGHVLREIRPWLEQHPVPQPVYLMQSTGKRGLPGSYWVPESVQFMQRGRGLPKSGTLIIFPAYVCGVYDVPAPRYKDLWTIEPIGWVGHAMPVFDLNQLEQNKKP